MLTRKPSPLPGFVALYRWRIRPELEEAFVQAWSRTSDLLRPRGSLGSRLHRGSDGLWYSYAQWSSPQARADAFAFWPVDVVASAQMQDAIVESSPEIVLKPVADYLVPLLEDGA